MWIFFSVQELWDSGGNRGIVSSRIMTEQGEQEMNKKDLTVPAILAEAIGIILGIVYVIMQIYYGITYKVAPWQFSSNIVGVVLVYVALTILSSHPEWINRLPREVCVGKVRKYSIRMVRLIKLVFLAGLMIPCVGDVLGIELKEAYSLIMIAAILVIAIGYEIKIIEILRQNHRGS